MSKIIDILEKKIYENKPDNGSQGQYNYGRVNSNDSFLVFSQKYSNAKDSDIDLYTNVESWRGWDLFDTYPNGWLSGRDSKIGYESVITSRTSNATDKETWYDMEWSMYMFDGYYSFTGERTGTMTGNKIKAGIGMHQNPGNSGHQTSNKNTLAWRYWGYQYETDSIVHHIYDHYSNDNGSENVDNCQNTNPYGSSWCGRGLALDGPTDHLGSEPAQIKRFHLGGSKNDTGTKFSLNGFQRGVRGEYRNSGDTNLRKDNIIFITRTAADEKEKSGGKYRHDERDRIYVKTKVKKSSLYNIWKNQRGESKLFVHELKNKSDTRERNNNNWAKTNYNDYHYQWRDTWGNYAGRSENKTGPVNRLTRATVRVNAPTFNHIDALRPRSEGGANAAWVDTKKMGWWCMDARNPDPSYFLGKNQGHEQIGLNPKFDIDSTGWFDSAYQSSYAESYSSTKGKNNDFYTLNAGYSTSTGGYFKSSTFRNSSDFRPISQLSSSYDVDLQSYYDGSSNRHNILKVLTSAPNSVKLQFRLAENSNNLEIENESLDTYWHKYFDYWFFVVNWDWKDGDPGGGDCEEGWFDGTCLEQIAETFPKTNSELELNMLEDKYDLRSIHCNDQYERGYCTEYQDPLKKMAQHSYLDPGLKTIKAIVFSTLPMHGRYTAIHPPGGSSGCSSENDTNGGAWPGDYCAGYDWGVCNEQQDNYRVYNGDKDGCLNKDFEWYDPWTLESQPSRDGTWDYLNYVQAVNWKLVTIRINLTDAGAFPTPDFADIGGDDYDYLPYPEVVTLNPEIHGYPPSAQGTTSNVYKSSHPIISGLSKDSIYANSVNTIVKTDKFSSTEGTGKNVALKAKSLNPGGSLDEFGRFLGKSDIAQIRIFNKSMIDSNTIDMNYMLGISDLVVNDEEFHSYNDFNYWTGGSEEFYDSSVSFPKESPVGDIFIDEYDQFRNSCLFELNGDTTDGKTIIDTSGNSNKGILIGDFSVKKDDKNQPATRDSYIKVSKISKENGAF